MQLAVKFASNPGGPDVPKGMTIHFQIKVFGGVLSTTRPSPSRVGHNCHIRPVYKDMWGEAVLYVWHVHQLLCAVRNASPKGNGPRPLTLLSDNNIDAEAFLDFYESKDV